MKAFLKSQETHKDIVQISFTNKELNHLEWEGDDEFFFNGEMYDLIQKKTDGKKTIILCVSDKKETALLNEYQKTHKRNSSDSAIVQLISLQFVLMNECSLQKPEKIIEKIFIEHSFSLQDFSPVIIPQPPDVC